MSLQYECVRGGSGEEAFVLLSLSLKKNELFNEERHRKTTKAEWHFAILLFVLLYF